MLRNQAQDSAPVRYREAGEWLRGQRQYWQITRDELAEQAGIGNVSLIDGIEQGKVALPPVMQGAIARAFSLDRDMLANDCEAWYGQETAAAA